MKPQDAYNIWAAQYDTNQNKTRDIEARAIREVLACLSFHQCLEIGCGTGKNTLWLAEQTQHITAVDLSAEMLAKAKEKISSAAVQFVQADIMNEWTFANRDYDLITFSLVLEHIEHLEPVFKKAATVLRKGGYIYVGELHPFKQYTGSKARFDTEEGRTIVECYTHHISDFTEAAKQSGFSIEILKEFFDDEDRNSIPRLLVLVLKKI